ncbi:hypothetical protein AB6A40_009477 [Gnathostoma spinigerum]|uniref:Metalloendopeptidase n=1 Tax=Gnathostoma spinigerum TaxID=75299 RepID=A0ABD6EZZ9_9BILA
MFLPLEVLFIWSITYQISFADYNISKLVDRSIPESSTFLTAVDFENANKVSIDFGSLGIKISDLERGDLYQGDIVLEKHQHGARSARSAAFLNQKWKTSRIPYEISTQYGEDARAVIASAVADFELYTCIRFVERTLGDDDYIYIYPGDGCHSKLGHVGGKQELSLGEDCLVKGIVIHELMHALSFIHEQSRPDRDRYVKVNVDAIEDKMTDQFERFEKNEVDHLGVQYNYNSLMHYGPKAFSRDGRPTIVPLNKKAAEFMGQRLAFSVGDVTQIRKLYQCKGQIRYTEPDFERLTIEDLKKQQIEFCDRPLVYCDFDVDCSDMKDYIRCPKTCRKCRASEIVTVEKCDGSSNSICDISSHSCSKADTDIICPRSCNKCRREEIPKIETCDNPGRRCAAPNCNDNYVAAQCGLTCSTLKCRPEEIPKRETCGNPRLRCVHPDCSDYIDAIQCGLSCHTLKCK